MAAKRQRFVVDCSAGPYDTSELSELTDAAKVAIATGEFANARHLLAEAEELDRARLAMPAGELVDFTDEENAQRDEEEAAALELELERHRAGVIARRDELLRASDWRMLDDAGQSDGARTKWAAYRAKLRDLGETIRASDKPQSVTFPSEPG